MYRTTFLREVQFATPELFDSTFGEQQKSLQAKLDLNEKYEQRPKFFISIEWFVVCDNGFCFSSSFYVVVVIFVVIWHRPKNVVTGREGEIEREREREREFICKL